MISVNDCPYFDPSFFVQAAHQDLLFDTTLVKIHNSHKVLSSKPDSGFCNHRIVYLYLHIFLEQQEFNDYKSLEALCFQHFHIAIPYLFFKCVWNCYCYRPDSCHKCSLCGSFCPTSEHTFSICTACNQSQSHKYFVRYRCSNKHTTYWIWALVTKYSSRQFFSQVI